jgi:hypothetical protein
MEQTIQTKSCGLLYLGGVAGWDFWWIGREPESEQYVVWQVFNHVDGISVTCHSDLRWVQLMCFSTHEIASCGQQVDEIDSASGRRVSYLTVCQGATVSEVFHPGG